MWIRIRQNDFDPSGCGSATPIFPFVGIVHCTGKMLTFPPFFLQIHLEAEKIFQNVGKQLKQRRHDDDFESLFSYLSDPTAEDPAVEEPELARQLEAQGREARKKIDKVFDDFEERQVTKRKSSGNEDSDEEAVEEEEDEDDEDEEEEEEEEGDGDEGDGDEVDGDEVDGDEEEVGEDDTGTYGIRSDVMSDEDSDRDEVTDSSNERSVEPSTVTGSEFMTEPVIASPESSGFQAVQHDHKLEKDGSSGAMRKVTMTMSEEEDVVTLDSD